MREIKFRGYDKNSKCWRYGYYMQKNDTILCIASPEQRESNEHHLILFSGFCDWNMPLPYYQAEVDGNSLGQYIGSKDKNSKEIFEGDIVRHNGNIFLVKYFVKYGRFACSTNKEMNKLDMCILNFEACEIVGNIYENEELIKN